VQLRGMLEKKQISCRELTESYLERIEKQNGRLRALITITEEEALQTADTVDKKISKGEKLRPLEGIPMAVKDNISTMGIETTCASRMLSGYKPIYDAHVWQLLKQQNAPLLGKCNMDEFSMGSTCETSLIGGAKNPHDTNRVAGGSSGGSASSVAANMAAYSLGSDTGGSIRLPASFCGLIGLKPTYGSVSRYGLFAYASSMEQIGPIAFSAEDAAIVFDVISERDTRDMTSKGISEKTHPQLGRSLSGLRIGISDEMLGSAGDDVSRAVREAADVYRKLGAQLVPVSFSLQKYVLPVYYILSFSEASSNLGCYDGIRFGPAADKYDDIDHMISLTRSMNFGREVKLRLLLGTYILSSGPYDVYYKKAQNLRSIIAKQIKEEIFNHCDVFLSPTAPFTAFKSGTNLSSENNGDSYTTMANLTGLPAISLPCGYDVDNMPIGMQLIGKHFCEAQILNAAYMFERETDGAFLSRLETGYEI
jgi:aspartyl-tRNA(Asn)/glutamyl-tRNA(Gln) amidotransferase subunit A